MTGPPPPPSPPRDEKPTQPSPPVQEEFTPIEQTNSLPRKPQAPAVPEDDGFTRWEDKPNNCQSFWVGVLEKLSLGDHMIMAEMKSRRPDFQITMVSFRISVDAA